MLNGTLSDEAYNRNVKEIEEQLTRIRSELSHLEEERCGNVDVAREIMLFTKDIYKCYVDGPYVLKRQLLSFFWEKFEVEYQEGKLIIKSHYSPLFRELLDLKMAYIKKPESKKDQENKGNIEVIKSTTLGAYRDLNSD